MKRIILKYLRNRSINYSFFKEGFNLSLGEAGISATAFIQVTSFIGVITGAIMIYAGGALKDAGISLSVVFQISAAGVLLSGLILLLIRPKAES